AQNSATVPNATPKPQPPVMEKPQLPQTGTITTTTPMTEERAPMDQLAAAAPPAPEPMLTVRDKSAAGVMVPMPATIAPQGGFVSRDAGEVNALVPMAQGDTFQKFDENRVKVTKTDPVSTFSIDVDTASYSYVRAVLKDGNMPQPDAVRLEE